MALIDILWGGGDTWIPGSVLAPDSANFILELSQVSYTGGLTDIIPCECGNSRPVVEISPIRFPIINGSHVIRVK
jgi:hypothetical protein